MAKSVVPDQDLTLPDVAKAVVSLQDQFKTLISSNTEVFNKLQFQEERLLELEEAKASEAIAGTTLPGQVYEGLELKDLFVPLLCAAVQCQATRYPDLLAGHDKTAPAYRKRLVGAAVDLAMQAVDCVLERMPGFVKGLPKG